MPGVTINLPYSLILSFWTFVLCLIPPVRNSSIGSYVKFGPMGFIFLHFLQIHKNKNPPRNYENDLNNFLLLITRLCAAFADLILHGETKSQFNIFVAIFLFCLGWISFIVVILKSNYQNSLIKKKWDNLTLLGKALFIALLLFGFFVEFFIVYYEESVLKYIYAPYILCQILTFVAAVFFLENHLGDQTINFVFAILCFAFSDLIVLAEMKFHITLYLMSWPLYYLGQYQITLILWDLQLKC